MLGIMITKARQWQSEIFCFRNPLHQSPTIQYGPVSGSFVPSTRPLIWHRPRDGSALVKPPIQGGKTPGAHTAECTGPFLSRRRTAVDGCLTANCRVARVTAERS